MPETIVRFDDRRPIPAAVFIGNENDNLVESVAFELEEWLSEAIVYMYLTANGKSDVINIGTNRVFDVTRTHTHEAGRWEAYLEAYLNGDRVWHSDEFAMYVGALPAIGKQIEQQYPTAIEDALRAAEMLTGLRARAETLPEGSEPTVRFDEEAGEIVYGLPLGPKGEAGFSPTIRTTAVSGGYEISITNPDGSMSVFMVTNGVSPTVRVSKIDGGNRVTITDASGPKTFNVMDGKDGDKVTAETVKAALGYTPASDARVTNLEQDMAEVKKITDNFELFVPKFANTAEGETLVLTDSAEGALQGLKVYGKTTQDGTPTPAAPVPLVSVGDDGAVDVTVEGDGSTQTLTISTPSGLPSVGDVCDEIDLERGVYVQRTLKTQLTSTMGWYAAMNGKRIYTEIKTLQKELGSPILCTHAVKGEWASDAEGTICLGNKNVGAVGFSTADFATVDAVKAFLDANDVYIVAALITPIEIPLSDEEIAAFKALKTHYPTTTVYNDESAQMAVKYAADTKNYIDQHLAALAAAMVNNL